MTNTHAIKILEEEKSWESNDRKIDAFIMGIEALKAVDKIINIIKIEQQPTSCEHTKLKSFEMIEKVITDYQLMFYLVPQLIQLNCLLCLNHS